MSRAWAMRRPRETRRVGEFEPAPIRHLPVEARDVARIDLLQAIPHQGLDVVHLAVEAEGASARTPSAKEAPVSKKAPGRPMRSLWRPLASSTLPVAVEEREQRVAAVDHLAQQGALGLQLRLALLQQRDVTRMANDAAAGERGEGALDPAAVRHPADLARDLAGVDVGEAPADERLLGGRVSGRAVLAAAVEEADALGMARARREEARRRADQLLVPAIGQQHLRLRIEDGDDGLVAGQHLAQQGRSVSSSASRCFSAVTSRAWPMTRPSDSGA
jgi:hypothetical protein